MSNSYYYNNGFVYYSPFSWVLPVLAALVIIAGGIALYCLFVRRPNHYQGTAAKLHDVHSFRTLYGEPLIKLLYCITICALTVTSVVMLFTNFFVALLIFVGGNIAARICFELTLLLFRLCRHTREINEKMGFLPTPPEPPAAQPNYTAPQQPAAPQAPAQPTQSTIPPQQ